MESKNKTWDGQDTRKKKREKKKAGTKTTIQFYVFAKLQIYIKRFDCFLWQIFPTFLPEFDCMLIQADQDTVTTKGAE